MNKFVRYLASLLLHIVWARSGKSGPVPPVRLPGKKGPTNLPAIGPWQMMIAMWLVRKIWERHGSTIKTRLMTNANDLARRAGSLIPDPNLATSGAGGAAATTAIPSPTPRPAPTPVPQTPRNYNTQALDDDADNAPSVTTQGTPSNLPQGSILSKLRGRS